MVCFTLGEEGRGAPWDFPHPYKIPLNCKFSQVDKSDNSNISLWGSRIITYQKPFPHPNSNQWTTSQVRSDRIRSDQIGSDQIGILRGYSDKVTLTGVTLTGLLWQGLLLDTATESSCLHWLVRTASLVPRVHGCCILLCSWRFLLC